MKVVSTVLGIAGLGTLLIFGADYEARDSRKHCIEGVVANNPQYQRLFMFEDSLDIPLATKYGSVTLTVTGDAASRKAYAHIAKGDSVSYSLGFLEYHALPGYSIRNLKWLRVNGREFD
jgi:hypothetical protein